MNISKENEVFVSKNNTNFKFKLTEADIMRNINCKIIKNGNPGVHGLQRVIKELDVIQEVPERLFFRRSQ